MPQFIQSNIHIQLSNSKFIRKDILESALYSNSIQQSTLEIKKLQEMKRKKFSELKKKVNEIHDVAKELHLKEFPQMRDKKEKTEAEKKQEPKIKDIGLIKSTEENDLMKELNDIKSKLDSIYL